MSRLRSWLGVTLAAAFFVGLVEGGLLQRRFGYFTGGFLSDGFLETVPEVLAFLLTSFISDAALVGCLAAAALWCVGRSRLHGDARLLLAFAFAVGPVLVDNFINYQVLAYVGTVDLGLMLNLGQGRVRELLAIAAPSLGRPAIWVVSGLAGLGLATWWAHRRTGLSARPVTGPRWGQLAAVVLVALLAQGVVLVSSRDVAWGFRWKSSGRVAGAVFTRVLDFDRDGFTILSRPPDQAPFDAARHPFAVEIPGNGVDENGVCGDLPASFPEYHEPAVVTPTFTSTPDVVLVLLEGVRADAVGRQVNGRPVTPVIDALAASGRAVPMVMAHVASTSPSRHSLMTGSLTSQRGKASLVDDFKANGYQVLYVSGQDESFGLPRFDVGFDRADVHWDARRKVDARYTMFATPGSLAVPASEVVAAVHAALADADRDRPLFLYVNFHDTHFPYHHAGVRPLVSSTVVAQRDINPANAGALREMYYNTVAHVDAAIGQVLADVERSRAHAAVTIVTSDHGEGLYDTGTLGHGLVLEGVQNRVPFVVTGIDLRLPDVVGLSEVRPALLEALARSSGAGPVPRGMDASRDGVFVYAGAFDRPAQIGFMGRESLAVVDLREMAKWVEGGKWTSLRDVSPLDQRFSQLVWTWESIARSLPEAGTR